MNPAIIIDYYPPNHDGGDSVFARDIAIGLRERVTPIVFTRIPEIDCTREFNDSGTKVVYLGSNWQDIISDYIPNIDLVHFFQVDNLPVVQFMKEKKDLPILFHMEMSYRRYSELFKPDFDKEKYHQIEQKAVELSDKIIVPCNYELAQIARLYPSANTIVVPNGINFETRLQTPFEIHKDDNKTNFAFMGRLDDPMKGGNALIEAIGQLPVDYSKRAHFVFIGCRDTRFLDRLNLMDKDISYEVHTWISDESDLWDKLSQTNFMFIPSGYETFGMVCLEAMAMGIIPIVSDAGAMGEMVINGKNGFLIGRSNSEMPKKISEVIESSIDMSSTQYRTMRDVAVSNARSHYNIERIVEKIIPIYNTMRQK